MPNADRATDDDAVTDAPAPARPLVTIGPRAPADPWASALDRLAQVQTQIPGYVAGRPMGANISEGIRSAPLIQGLDPRAVAQARRQAMMTQQNTGAPIPSNETAAAAGRVFDTSNPKDFREMAAGLFPGSNDFDSRQNFLSEQPVPIPEPAPPRAPQAPQAPQSPVERAAEYASQIPGANVNVPQMTRDVTLAQRNLAAMNAASAEAMQRLLKADVERIHQKADGVLPLNAQNWDADSEKAARTTDPISQFGSIGALFGALASSFTRQPGIIGNNALAAALDGIKHRDDAAYDRAFKAWQENTKLELDRHKVQQEAFQNSLQLLTADEGAGKASLYANAVRFGDERMLALLNAGMLPEALQIVAQRADYGERLLKLRPLTEQALTADRIFAADPNSNSPNEELKAAARIRADILAGKPVPPSQLAMQQYIREQPTIPPSEDLLKFMQRTQLSQFQGNPDVRAKEELRQSITQRMLEQKRLTDPTATTLSDAERKQVEKEVSDATSRNQPREASKFIDFLSDNNHNIFAKKPDGTPYTAQELSSLKKEDIEKYTRELETLGATQKVAEKIVANPAATGLLAEVAANRNVYSWLNIFKDERRPRAERDAALASYQSAFDAEVTRRAEAQGLSGNTAEDAKLLNKMMITTGLKDAASTGQRVTVYLDKMFREIYDPKQRPDTLLRLLYLRAQEANESLGRFAVVDKNRKPLIPEDIARERHGLLVEGPKNYIDRMRINPSNTQVAPGDDKLPRATNDKGETLVYKNGAWVSP
jgi:hypothetical protein